MNDKKDEPFRLLSDEEFLALPVLERVDYLMRAMEVRAVIERQIKHYLDRHSVPNKKPQL